MLAKDNPFGAERVLTVRYRLRGATWEELMARLERLEYRAAIVGPEGSGKTTLLEDLAPCLRKRGFAVRFLRLDDATPYWQRWLLLLKYRAWDAKTVLLFDGAELAPSPAWRWFRARARRRAAGLLITSHRPGLLPTLMECGTTPELLQEIVEQLLPGESSAMDEKLKNLYSRHQGNFRLALRELYDEYAGK
ncbi:MAG: hypothetical protein NTX50_17415 [Candidatus Sumerlaeota bacterium]|nr:hypothetical protein [Candidatus Sumerlaeota bacterium]